MEESCTTGKELQLIHMYFLSFRISSSVDSVVFLNKNLGIKIFRIFLVESMSRMQWNSTPSDPEPLMRLLGHSSSRTGIEMSSPFVGLLAYTVEEDKQEKVFLEPQAAQDLWLSWLIAYSCSSQTLM